MPTERRSPASDALMSRADSKASSSSPTKPMMTCAAGEEPAAQETSESYFLQIPAGLLFLPLSLTHVLAVPAVPAPVVWSSQSKFAFDSALLSFSSVAIALGSTRNP